MVRFSYSLPLSHLLLTVSFVSLLGFSSVWSVPTDSTDAKAIMDAVENQPDGDRSTSRLTMTIQDKDGRKRVRVVSSKSIKFKEGTKQLMRFESPADIRGTGLLSVDYDDGNQDDDQWLFLPSLHKSTRISSGEKSGSFMGTDLSFSDMTKADPKQYTYKTLKPSVKVKLDGQEEECWLIESRPATAKAKSETGYLKSHVWVSKSKLLPVQIKSWVREGKKLKYIQFKQIKKIDGLWTPHTIIARTKKGKKTESTTILQFTEMAYNQAQVTEDLFTQSQLEQGQ